VNAYAWAALADPILATIVYLDARRLGIRYGEPASQGAGLGAVGWALGTLIAPIVYLPAYLLRRRHVHQRERRAA
jgi:hypothetical protein